LEFSSIRSVFDVAMVTTVPAIPAMLPLRVCEIERQHSLWHISGRVSVRSDVV